MGIGVDCHKTIEIELGKIKEYENPTFYTREITVRVRENKNLPTERITITAYADTREALKIKKGRRF